MVQSDPAYDLCGACGHERCFHDVGTGNGVPIGEAYCDDRHAEPCSCNGFRRAVREASTDERPLEIAFAIDVHTLTMPEARRTLEFIAGILRDKGLAFSAVITSDRV